MPIGFAKSILTGGAGTGVDWANWDGSNDSTITVSSLTHSPRYGRWIGFCDFNDDYGLIFGIENLNPDSGANYDKIVYAKLQNSSDTLTYSGQATHITTASTAYTDTKGIIVKTNGGNIYAAFNVSGDARIYSISDSTVTQHTAFSNTNSGTRGYFYRQPGSDVFVNHNSMPSGELVTLTDNGNSSSDSTGTETIFEYPTGTDNLYFYSDSYIVPGFTDANTIMKLQSPNVDNGDEGLPVKMDLTSTGTGKTPGTFAGLSAVAFDLESANNLVSYTQTATPQFPTTDFNDRMLIIERLADNFKITNYKSGDTSYSQTTLTDTDIEVSDTSMQGIFVGPNNTVFLFIQLDTPNNKLFVWRYNTSTNVCDKALTISHGESFNQEQCRICRWGNDRAVLMYNDNKIRLLVP